MNLKATPTEIIAPAVEKFKPYVQAKSFDELDERAKQFFKNVDGNFRHFKDLDVANAVMEAIHNVHQKVPSLEIKALELKNVKLKGATASMSHN